MSSWEEVPGPPADAVSGSLLLLSRSDVAARLPGIEEQIGLAAGIFDALAQGEVEMPPKIGIHPRPNAFIHAMPAYLKARDVAVIKWVSGYPSNPGIGLPYISGVIVVNNPATGVPVAVLDAAEITACRTAAASGVCIRAFAPADWSRVAILGCGEQGRYHARVVRALRSDAVIVAYDVDPSRAASLCEGVEVAASAREAVEGADVVVTAGPIVEHPQPVLAPDWIPERCLLLPIDFDFYVTRDAIESCSLFVVDDVDQFEYYRRQGHFQEWPEPRGSVGDALRSGRRGARSACVNLGVAALDAVFAEAVLRAGEQPGKA